MDTLIQDLRYAVRTLARSPGFTIVAILTLALGIGANTAIFSVIEGVLLRPLPYPHADRLVTVFQVRAADRRQGVIGNTSPLAAFERWRTARRSFGEVTAYTGDAPVLARPGAAERVNAYAVSANFFSMLGTRPVLGRAFAAAEDRPGAGPVAILSHRLWQSRFDANPAIVGRSITLDTTVYTIVGVMPADFRYPPEAQVWENLGAALSGPAGAARARMFSFWVLGRLRAGVTPAEAQSELDVVQRRSWSSDPAAAGWLPSVLPLRDLLVGSVRTPLLIMLGAVGLVLLVACANVASLLLARAAGAWREMAIRVTLGASRSRVLRETLVGGVALGIVGGAVGLVLALWGVPAIVTLAGSELPRFARVAVDIHVLVACFSAGALAGLLAGLGPALRAARSAPADVLKAAGVDPKRPGEGRSLDALVVAQVALTMVLLAGAGLLARSFVSLTRVAPGFEPAHVVVAQLELPATYGSAAHRVSYVQQVLMRVRAIPGASAAAVATGIPFAAGAIGSVSLPGEPDRNPQAWAYIAGVTPDYFRTLEIPLERGRGLAASDPGVVVIDETAAQAYFPGEDPLEKLISFYGGRQRRIVGVVGNTRQDALGAPPPPHIYEAYTSDPGSWLKVIVRVAGPPEPVIGPLRRALASVEPGVPLEHVTPMTSLLTDSLAQQRLYTSLLLAFAAMALALALAGMFGIVSYGVSRRTREIGIRMAMGAGRGDVLIMIVSRGLVRTGAGLAIGAGGALATTRLLRAFLFDVAPTDPVTLGCAALTLVAATVAASWVPARRAAKVDPMVALRSE